MTRSVKIAVLYQSDDFGKDGLKGLRDGLGARASKIIVATASYEVSDPTVDSQIITLQASGANTLVILTTLHPPLPASFDFAWRLADQH